MDLHIYTRELLDKHLLPELKEIAQGLGIIPNSNKTRRETWVAALVGQPFPVFQSLDLQRQEPIENPPAVEIDRAQEPVVETIENPPGVEIDRPQEPVVETVEVFPGVDRVEESIALPDEKSLDVDRAQESIEFPDLESALAEIARLRVQNEKLLELARSQSEKIGRAKDISPVDRPSFRRVRALAREALLDVSKNIGGGWLLSLGSLKRHFKRLREIWDLLVPGEWYLSDIFPEPSASPEIPPPIFPPIRSKYSAIPFCGDDLIDIWSLGAVNAVSSGRSPPGGEAM